jgi:L-alanine-DL-glutamate epimerase-like enolase superfamily enzyme
MSQIQLEYFPFRLNFKYPFRLSHTERTGTDNVYLLLKTENAFGWGECVFIPYYTETLETFKNLISKIELPENTEDISKYINGLKSNFPNTNFCIAAIDIALHNLHANLTNTSIQEFYQIEGQSKKTSFTIGMSNDQEMEIKIADNPSMNYYKLKVNQSEVYRIIDTFERFSEKPFTIDANQGFTDRNEALKLSYKLADKGVWYLEQPFHKEDFESHAWLKARSPIPIIADESFQNYADLEKIVKSFDGINLKVMKCGGLAEGVECLKRAKEMELKSIIGCMSESSVAIDASMQIAPLADWVDLDGNLLITNDLFGDKNNSNESIIEELKKGRN